MTAPHRRNTACHAALSLLLALIASGAVARAGNDSSFFLGNLAALSGGAVTVVGDDGASLWYNPAGLAVSRRDRIDLSGSAYTLRIRNYPGILRGDLPDRDDDADPKLTLSSTDLLTVPASVAYVRHVGKDVSLGFGLFVPLLDRFATHNELAVREPNVHLDASVDLSAETTVYTGAIGLGWRASPCLRLGATLALYDQTIDLAQTLLFGYDSPVEGDPRQGNGTVVQQDTITRFGFNVFLGAQWQFAEHFALGAVVRTPVIQLYDSLERRRFQLGADVDADDLTTISTQFQPLRESGFTASVYRSMAGTLALAWTPETNTFLSLEVDMQMGSKDDGETRDFVWNVRLGGVVPLSDKVRIGAGLFTDQSPQPPPVAAWIDKVDFYGVATGIYLETPLALAPGSEAPSLVFTTTIGLRYALGIGTTLRAVADPSGVHTDPSMTSIDVTFHEIGVHLGSGLRF